MKHFVLNKGQKGRKTNKTTVKKKKQKKKKKNAYLMNEIAAKVFELWNYLPLN